MEIQEQITKVIRRNVCDICKEKSAIAHCRQCGCDICGSCSDESPFEDHSGDYTSYWCNNCINSTKDIVKQILDENKRHDEYTDILYEALNQRTKRKVSIPEKKVRCTKIPVHFGIPGQQRDEIIAKAIGANIILEE